MENEHLKQSRETGKNVWESFQGQMAEGNGFLGAMFLSFKLFVRRHFWSFLIFGIIASLIGGGIWYLKPKHFQSEMTVSYVHYEKKIYADMLQKLNNLVQLGNYDVLSDVLGMPEDDISKVLSIRSLNIKREPLLEDLSVEKLPFYIIVSVSNPDILPVLETGIVNYLDNTDFIQDRLDYMRTKAIEELVFLERRLAIADSLSKMYIIREDGIGMNDEKAITRMELLDETMQIYRRIQEVRGLLTFNLNIEVLDGFVVANKTASKSLIHFLMMGFFIGLGVRLVLLVFK